jgi:predicted PurR-regulated permease PerM
MRASRPGWRITLWAVIAVAALAFIWAVRKILLPFILAFLISVLLEPVVAWMTRKGWRRPGAVVTVLLAFFGLILVGLVALMPKVTEQVTGLKDKGEQLISAVAKPNPRDNFFYRGVPENRIASANSKDPIDRFLGSNADILSRANLPTTKRGLVAQYIEPQREQITKGLQNGIKSSVSILSGILSQGFTLIFVPLLTMMIMMDSADLKRRLMNLIPPQLRAGTGDLAEDLGDVLRSYFRGVGIAVFGYMLFMSLLLSILGAPYGLLLGAFFGMIYLIPYLSVLISGSTLFLVTGLSGKTDWFGIHFASSWNYAGVLLATYIICHFVFDMLVFPRFVGNAVGLHPIVSMLVIFSGGALFGLPGMILAFPVAGCIKVILDRLLKITNKVEGELILPEIPLRHREVLE